MRKRLNLRKLSVCQLLPESRIIRSVTEVVLLQGVLSVSLSCILIPNPENSPIPLTSSFHATPNTSFGVGPSQPGSVLPRETGTSVRLPRSNGVQRLSTWFDQLQVGSFGIASAWSWRRGTTPCSLSWRCPQAAGSPVRPGCTLSSVGGWGV